MEKEFLRRIREALASVFPFLQKPKPFLSPQLRNSLSKADWETRDVLVGILRGPEQLEVCLQERFYHMPADRLPVEPDKVKRIALYQPRSLFDKNCGIFYYADVESVRLLRRWEISQLPSSSQQLYYFFRVGKWKRLPRRIAGVETPVSHLMTTRFLLENSSLTPELLLRDREDYLLFRRLRLLAYADASGANPRIFAMGESRLLLEGDRICLYRDHTCTAFCTTADFRRLPDSCFAMFRSQLRPVLDSEISSPG